MTTTTQQDQQTDTTTTITLSPASWRWLACAAKAVSTDKDEDGPLKHVRVVVADGQVWAVGTNRYVAAWAHVQAPDKPPADVLVPAPMLLAIAKETGRNASYQPMKLTVSEHGGRCFLVAEDGVGKVIATGAYKATMKVAFPLVGRLLDGRTHDARYDAPLLIAAHVLVRAAKVLEAAGLGHRPVVWSQAQPDSAKAPQILASVTDDDVSLTVLAQAQTEDASSGNTPGQVAGEAIAVCAAMPAITEAASRG